MGGWGDGGRRELGIKSWGEEKIGRLDNCQLSTLFLTRNTAAWCASYGTRNFALSSHSALSTLHSALKKA
uniref:Uncharacterized protein n=1 Tax=Desertifilum tharense IPPAS B-1220 TaxID=1781255 RepID=A0ACD5GRT8_9CYAN